MKNSITLIAIASVMMFASCRKSYTCTCDTVQPDGSSAKTTYELKKQTHEDANDFCERYEDDLNSVKEGTTGCHL
jgi:hypothetical protein